MLIPVTTTVIIMVSATAEYPCRLRKVIRKPNPPNSIMCTSRITAMGSNTEVHKMVRKT